MLHKALTKLFRIKDSRDCPRCGRRMARVHRKAGDRLLSVLIPVIRCECCGQSRLVVPEDGRIELKVTPRHRAA